MTIYVEQSEHGTQVALTNVSTEPTFLRVRPDTQVAEREITIGGQTTVLAATFTAERISVPAGQAHVEDRK